MRSIGKVFHFGFQVSRQKINKRLFVLFFRTFVFLIKEHFIEKDFCKRNIKKVLGKTC